MGQKEKCQENKIYQLEQYMILRSGTIVSNMERSKTLSSRNFSSSDEVNNEGENSPVANQHRPLEPLLTPVTTTGQTTTAQAPSSMSTMAMSTILMYGLPPGFVLPMATQAQIQPGLAAISKSIVHKHDYG